MPTRPDWVRDDDLALVTDLYQLTMLQAYFREDMREDAVFDLFVRRLRERNFFIACGLDTVLHYLENLHFSDEALDYLGSLGQFDDAFLDYLTSFRFTGDVYAVPEGTPIFPDEPILEVVAPIGEAQLIETFLLNQITFQTNVATKAHRVVRAARGRTVSDFGMRRMHGADATLKAARACYIAGVHSTSNLLAGHLYDIPVVGTMAHSYVEAHDTEADAFRAFARLYPGTTLLVDTYDTLDGVRKIVELSHESSDAFRVGAVRLDSGDLAELARASRRILDEGGLEHVEIFASSSLDEYEITKLLDRGAPIDGFGVGTRLGTVADHPYLDSVYKLSAYAGTPRMKLSSEKSNLPGRKQVFRQMEDGGAVRDVIAVHDEAVDGRPLLEQVMRNGQRLAPGRTRPLSDLRRQAEQALAELPPRLHDLDKSDAAYPVVLSDRLQERLTQTRRALEAQMEVNDGSPLG